MLGLGLILASGSAAAQSSGATSEDKQAQARQLGYDGVRAYQAGQAASGAEQLEQFQEAKIKLGEAFDLVPVPTLGLYLGRTLKELGELVDAKRAFEQVLRLQTQQGDQSVQGRARQDAATELGKLVPLVPSITLSVQGASRDTVEVLVDGKAIPGQQLGQSVFVDPGPHAVVGRWKGGDGGAVVEKQVSMRTGQQSPIVLDFSGVERPGAVDTSAMPEESTVEPSLSEGSILAPAPGMPVEPTMDERSSGWTQSTTGWTLAGAGGGLLVVSGVTGFLALNKTSDMDCDGGVCTTNDPDAESSYNQLRSMATVGYIAGGILAATGITLLLTDSGSDSELALQLGPASAALSGRF
jgi:hypothetical protein